MSKRNEKLQEALRIAAAEFIVREAGPQSLITVTATSLSDDMKRARIYITVLPESQENIAVQFANRNRKEFSDFFTTRVRGVGVPHVEFVIDKGEKMRQRLDELS